MHRIDCPTATPDNKFTEGDPTIPVAATTVTADWLNAVQEELAAVIAGAELSLDKANNAQLLQALHKILDLRAPLATLLQAGLMQPDGKTVSVDEAGLLTALGGNLLLNSEEWITVSGEWEALVTGWHEILLIDGGAGGLLNTSVKFAHGGQSGRYETQFVYLIAGQVVPVVVGAGSLAFTGTTTSWPAQGGRTSFNGLTTKLGTWLQGAYASNISNEYWVPGGGFGGMPGGASGSFYGAGGGVYTFFNNAANHKVANGVNGAIRVRWYDPAKAGGPLPEPALLSARRMVSRASDAPVTVNLYDPETGQGSVWREEDVPAKLAEGMITEDAWQEICAAKAAEDYAAWLSSPDTEAQRIEQLRMACEAKLTATDKLTAPDYPISDEDRAAVNAYRKAIRELNHQPGAPWDGGGEATPWPVEPVVTKVQEA